MKYGGSQYSTVPIHNSMMHIKITTIHTTTALQYDHTHNNPQVLQPDKNVFSTIQQTECILCTGQETSSTHVQIQEDGPTVHNQTNKATWRQKTHQPVYHYIILMTQNTTMIRTLSLRMRPHAPIIYAL